MAIVLTNSLTKKKEAFVPAVPGQVKMYVCGPTVYNFIHIGNARPCVFYDVVERYLKFSGLSVTRVMNFTDVEDKIIVKAREEKTDSLTVSERYAKEFLSDMHSLGITPPAVAPKVTEHIPEIIALIEGLIKTNAAYLSEDGEVFFSVRNFPGYGKLSGKNIDDLISGERVQSGEKKRDPLDFSLWKPRKLPDEPAWESPWGLGRPGWHIECSAMAMRYLGESFDLHGGGMDLIHPHHENEIAQSEAFTHKPYVKYWMHSNMLTFNAEKMSKSLGNIMLTRDFIKKYSAEVLRFFLLSAHYRSTIDYSEQHIREVQSGLHRIYSCLLKARAATQQTPASEAPASHEENKLVEFSSHFESRWREAMDDDFNTAMVIGIIFEYVRLLNTYLYKKGFKASPQTKPICESFLGHVKKLSAVLNLMGEEPQAFLNTLKTLVLTERGILAVDIDKAISERSAARLNKDFKTSDRIRDELLAKGIEIRDEAGITEWDIAFQIA